MFLIIVDTRVKGWIHEVLYQASAGPRANGPNLLAGRGKNRRVQKYGPALCPECGRGAGSPAVIDDRASEILRRRLAGRRDRRRDREREQDRKSTRLNS